MRKIILSISISVLAAAMFAVASSTPSPAQTGDQIAGKTCKQLFRSCFRICVHHKGEAAYQGCEADCNSGNKSCRRTGTWKSKNAIVTAETPPKKKK